MKCERCRREKLHLFQCKVCGNKCCGDCAMACPNCDGVICYDCVISCNACERLICPSCSRMCQGCGSSYCIDCAEEMRLEEMECGMCGGNKIKVTEMMEGNGNENII